MSKFSWEEQVAQYEAEHRDHIKTLCEGCKRKKLQAEWFEGWDDDVDPNELIHALNELEKNREYENAVFHAEYTTVRATTSKKTSDVGSPLFSAKWSGKCKECGDTFRRWDQIGYAEGKEGPLCAACHGIYDTFTPYDNY